MAVMIRLALSSCLVAAVVPTTSAFAGPASRLSAALGVGLAVMLAYMLLQHVAFSIAMRRTYVPFVRRALTARGHPTCVACGHLLGPRASAACPECGAATRGNG